MFINVTKKASKMFRSYPGVKSPSEGQAMAQANPIFSWHANYFTDGYRRNLILINDATLLTVVLANVKSNKGSKIQGLFNRALTKRLRKEGLSSTDIMLYLEQSGDWQVNKIINKSVLGYLNRMINKVEWALKGVIDNQQAARVMYKVSQSDNFTKEDLALFRHLDWQKPEKEPVSNQEKLSLKKVVDQLRAIDEHYDQTLDQGDEKIERQQAEQIVNLNNHLIDAFIDSVRGHYAQATVHRYQSQLDDYLNGYCAWDLITIFNPEVFQLNEPVIKGEAVSKMKGTRTALKKLYDFLSDQGAISRIEANSSKQELNHVSIHEVYDDDEFDDWDEDDDWDEMDEKDQLDILNAYLDSVNPLDPALSAQLMKYCTAIANLYGLVDVTQAHLLLLAIDPGLKKQLQPHDFNQWVNNLKTEAQKDFVVDKIGEISFLINHQIYEDALQEKLFKEQVGKVFYTPDKEELLKYQQSDYRLQSPAAKAYQAFLTHQLAVSKADATQLTNALINMFNYQFDEEFHNFQSYALEDLADAGYGISSKKQWDQWEKEFDNLYNHTRLFVNRGQTKPEINQKDLNPLRQTLRSGKMNRALINQIASCKIAFMDILFMASTSQQLSLQQKANLISQVFTLSIDD